MHDALGELEFAIAPMAIPWRKLTRQPALSRGNLILFASRSACKALILLWCPRFTWLWTEGSTKEHLLELCLAARCQ